MDKKLNFYATTTPGLEYICEKELAKCPSITDVRCFTTGGVVFQACPMTDFSLIKSITSLNVLVGTMDDIPHTDVTDSILER